MLSIVYMETVGGEAEAKNATQNCEIWLGGLSMNRHKQNLLHGSEFTVDARL